MARLPRLAIPGYVHHLSQQGNNGQAIALSVADFSFFLRLLGDAATQHRVHIHAYLLMSSQVQLLVTPNTADDLSMMMQSVGRRYARYFNDLNLRTGTLWEGRYKSTVIEAERYLMETMVYLDVAPVTAGLVAQPREYPWSSHAHYAGICADKLITPHPNFWRLGNTPFEREAAYVDLVNQGCSAETQEQLERGLRGGWVLGSKKFTNVVAALSARRVVPSPAGRPPTIKKGRIESDPD